jgi:hypothetical protein
VSWATMVSEPGSPLFGVGSAVIFFILAADTDAWACLSYGPPWAHYLRGYQDRLLGGPLGLPDLCRMVLDGVRCKDYGGEVLG